jgi:hypothetical protein
MGLRFCLIVGGNKKPGHSLTFLQAFVSESSTGNTPGRVRIGLNVVLRVVLLQLCA